MTERKANCIGLGILAWVMAIASLPIYFIAMIGVGMSPAAPHMQIGEGLLLLVCPMAGLVCCWIARGMREPRRMPWALWPVILLSVIEIGYTLIIWSQG
jgi:hypothetical protein